MKINILGGTALALLATVTTSAAGGFSRGAADTKILYEDGNFNMRSGVTLVVPQRGFETIDGAVAVDDDFTDTFAIPSAALKINLTDDLRCAGTFTEVYGGKTTYGDQAFTADLSLHPLFGVPTSNATRSTALSIEEAGATCAYKHDIGKGRLWLLGGVFVENFDYEEVTALGTLTFDGAQKAGYRLGAAYEIPEIALRVEGMYRSAVNHTPDGQYIGLVPNPMGGAPILMPGVYSVKGAGTTPQSFEFSAQSGIAADTMAFLNVKWTDWSVVDTIDYVIGGVVPAQNRYFWRDGWTVSAGLGHKFSESVSGLVTIGWDRGVSTGVDVRTDTWTLGSGVSMKDPIGGELRLGGALSYLSAGSQSRARGAGFDATVGGDFAFAASGGYSIKW